MQRSEFCLEKQTNSIKNKAHGAISEDNIKDFKRLCEYFSLDPNEEISVKGFYWTCLHYAAHFKSLKILEFLLVQIYKDNRENFQQIVNLQTKEGWTPPMVAAIYNSVKALDIFLKFGGIDLNIEDKDGKKIIDLAKKYGAYDSKELAQKYLNNFPDGKIPINVSLFDMALNEPMNEEISEKSEKLSKSPELSKENKEQFKKLLFEGVRVPCIICLSNLGYLHYTSCCGQPLHKPCKGSIHKCPFCNYNSFELITEVLYPNRAFVLDLGMEN